MSLRRRTMLVAGPTALLVAGLVVALVHGPAQAPTRLTGSPIAVQKTISPRNPQFGDAVTATVDVSVDPRRVDPRSVRAQSAFAPYRVTSSTRAVRRIGSVSIVHFEYRLRCLEMACVPQGGRRSVRLRPLRIAYAKDGRAATVQRAWPVLHVTTRVSAADLRQPFFRVGAPRPSQPDYRLPPGPTGYALLVLAALLALGGTALVARAAFRGRRLPRTEGSPTLEGILSQLASASSNGDPVRRRRALEQLARELEPLDESLSIESRVLAWSPEDPRPESIADLTGRVQAAVRP